MRIAFTLLLTGLFDQTCKRCKVGLETKGCELVDSSEVVEPSYHIALELALKGLPLTVVDVETTMYTNRRSNNQFIVTLEATEKVVRAMAELEQDYPDHGALLVPLVFQVTAYSLVTGMPNPSLEFMQNLKGQYLTIQEEVCSKKEFY